jgi:hypothetical protein
MFACAGISLSRPLLARFASVFVFTAMLRNVQSAWDVVTLCCRHFRGTTLIQNLETIYQLPHCSITQDLNLPITLITWVLQSHVINFYSKLGVSQLKVLSIHGMKCMTYRIGTWWWKLVAMYWLVGAAIHPFIYTFLLNVYYIYACLLNHYIFIIMQENTYFIHCSTIYKE